MYSLLFFLFVTVAILAFAEDQIPDRIKFFSLSALVTIMVITATVKDITTVADAETYEYLFYNTDNELISLTTEPTFVYLSRLVLYLGGSIAVIFCIYALISIPLKIGLIQKLTPFCFTALIIYIPVYYELHDLVQIRAAAAGAFLLLSIKMCADRKYTYLILTYITAILFHYSSIAFLPFFILGNKPLKRKGMIVLALIIPIGFLMYFLHHDLFSLIPSSLISGKADYYKSSAENGSAWDEMTIPYKNLYFMTKCILFYILLYYNDYIKDKIPYYPIVMKVEAGSLFVMLGMATVPILATRLSDLFGIIDSIFFSYCLYIVSPRYIAKIGITCVGLYMLIYNMLIAKYFG